VSAHAVTDEKGRYVLAPVRPERTPWLTARLADPPLVGTRRIDVRSVQAAHDLVVARPAWMRGTVLDVDGAPVEGAVVEIPSVKLSAMTDARGAYVLGPLPDPRSDRARVLDVVARRVGLGEQRLSASRPAALGEDVDGPVFRLGSGKDLEGYVQDTERRAVPFPVVEVEGLGGSRVRRVVAADEFGRFVVRDVPPGTYRVRGRSRGLDGYARDPVEVLPDAGAAPKVAPVILRAATTVTGYVVDDDEGDPVPGARVTLTSRAPTGMMFPVAPLRDETVTDARGWFQLTTAGAPELLEVRATHPSDRGRELTARQRVDGRDATDVRIEVR
jgi:protocatechuate 3,4-dioxygenase beta subunit